MARREVISSAVDLSGTEGEPAREAVDGAAPPGGPSSGAACDDDDAAAAEASLPTELPAVGSEVEVEVEDASASV
eukprot:7061546-Prymnesium_polylepis.1